jgi:probable rRNA maturation factor
MLEINNLSSAKIDKRFLEKTARMVLKKELGKETYISLAFVGQARIKELNNIYRKKDRPTDVLSFEGGEGLGEIVICPEIVRENSKKFKTSFKKELAKVFIHGILHLLGYDHEKSLKKAEKMEKKQESYLSSLNL